jgi:hypothetical protein
MFLSRIDFNLNELFNHMTVPMTERSEARTVFGHSNIRIVVSNPAPGMDVYPRFSVLCCPV